MSTAKLLVLGASGFLGRRIVRCAAGRRDLRVVASGRTRPAVVRVADWRPFDLEAGEAELERFLDGVGADRVLAAAARSRMGACEADPDRAGLLNAEVPARLATWCARRGARLVHVSTDLVFGGRPTPPGGLGEDEPPAPLSVYGETKARGEEAVRAADPRALVCRLPLLFGDSEGSGAGASDSLLADLGAGRTPRLFRDEWRTPLDVDDAAAALVELVLGEERGLLHVAGPERLSRVEFGLLVLRAHGRSAEEARACIETTTRAAAGLDVQRPRDTSLDATRARALLRAPLRAPALALGDPA